LEAAVAKGMQRAALDGVVLEYEVRGSGEPVLLVHAGAFADWFAPLLAEPSLAQQHALINYHRVGYGGSARPDGPISIADQATHSRMLMAHLGVERAHVVGHSSGANIALQLALDAPGSVRSLTLMEPAVMDVPGAREFAESYMDPVIRHSSAGAKAQAVDAFMRAVAGPRYRAAMDRALPPGHFARAVADADTFFGTELPALRRWSFRWEDAQRVPHPVLVVLGGESDAVSPVFRQRYERLLSRLPRAEPFVLPGTTHLLHLQNPGDMADGLARFFARHSMHNRPGWASPFRVFRAGLRPYEHLTVGS
jgi:pimeloyl-ACP methyl ester carboxylesterase